MRQWDLPTVMDVWDIPVEVLRTDTYPVYLTLSDEDGIVYTFLLVNEVTAMALPDMPAATIELMMKDFKKGGHDPDSECMVLVLEPKIKGH